MAQFNEINIQKSVSDWRLNALKEEKLSTPAKNNLHPPFFFNHYLTKSISTGEIVNSHFAEDDEFVDAPNEIIYSDSLRLLDTIAETHIAMNLFMNNQFEMAEERMEVLAHKSMYHALGYSTMLSIRAVMTCDRGDLERAMEACRKASTVIGQFRAKYSFAESIYKFGSQKRVLTDEEAHAELCYAEALMFRAVLTFFYDDNLTSLIKGAFKIRTCYQSFKECQKILNSEFWTTRDPRVKSQFEAGVRMGVGTFGLMLSTLPSKVIRLLEVVGFSGNKDIGMLELHLASLMKGTLRNPLSAMVLLCWHLIATFFVGGDNPDLNLCKRLLAPLSENYPNGAIILFLRARLYLVSGDVDNAIYFYNKSVKAQDTYQQFHHVCFWELVFAYCYLRKWDRAANNAKRLLNESKWSRCVYTYMLAIIIYADEHTPKRIETVRMLLHICTPIFVENILQDIELKWRVDPSEDINDLCLYMFLRGVCLKALTRNNEAENCFIKILELENLLTDYFYIAPNACFELALTRAGRGEDMEALLNRALAYRGYSLETKLHFRIHGTLESIRKNRGTRHLKQQQSPTSNAC